MKDILLSTILFALLASFVAFQTASDPSGSGKGHEKARGRGHEKHDCQADCPYCGGNPCIPPCDGTGGGGGAGV